MPSPFPGMDPYLEDPILWPGFHTRFITTLTTLLNGAMPGRYIADIGERVYVLQSDRSIYPDSTVFHRQDLPRTPVGASAATAISDPPLLVVDEPLEVREGFVEILALRPQRRVVALLEVLSPSNKQPGAGRDLYLAKQLEALRSQAHLIEIDLLLGGEHTVAAPRFRVAARGGPYNYLASLHRANLERRYETWPWLLARRLPRIAVPLLDGDADVGLDLQDVITRSYDEGAYQRQLDYAAPPPVALSPADAAWLDGLLRERGLRP